MRPAYVISLARCTERRDWITRHLGERGVSFEFLDAVDGQDLPQELVKKWYNASKFQEISAWRPAFTPGELGASLSHLQAWQRILDSSSPGAFVIEDDAVMRPGYSHLTLEKVAAQTRPGEVVLLQSSARTTWFWRRRRLHSEQIVIAYTLDETMMGTAYYLTREGAHAMFSRWQREGITFTLDHWYFRRRMHRPSWRGTLPVLVVKPELFWQHEGFRSEIAALGRESLNGSDLNRPPPPPVRHLRNVPRDVLRVLRRQCRRAMSCPARIA